MFVSRTLSLLMNVRALGLNQPKSCQRAIFAALQQKQTIDLHQEIKGYKKL